jgi:hypothetical protein
LQLAAGRSRFLSTFTRSATARITGSPAPRTGLTLIEILASTFLVGALLVGSLAAVGGIFRTWSAGATHRDALSLAEVLLAEILLQSYEEPADTPRFGRESGESSSDRSAWDDVDDYDGWTSAPSLRDGTALTGYTGWTCAVRIELVRVASPEQTATTDEGLKRIVLVVTEPSGRATTLVGYRSRWGGLETPPGTSVTVHSGVVSTLELDSAGTLYGGVPLFNHAQDMSHEEAHASEVR